MINAGPDLRASLRHWEIRVDQHKTRAVFKVLIDKINLGKSHFIAERRSHQAGREEQQPEFAALARLFLPVVWRVSLCIM